MAKPLPIKIKESVAQLRMLQKKYPSKYKPLRMLVIITEQGALSQKALSAAIGSRDKSVNKWRKDYLANGIDFLLEENRGGHKQGKITTDIEQKLHSRLNNQHEYYPLNHFRCI